VTERARNIQSSRQRSVARFGRRGSWATLNEAGTLATDASRKRTSQCRRNAPPPPSSTEWLRGDGASVNRELRCYHSNARAAFRIRRAAM